MNTPGYDPISATGQVAGGANMICFTTGRGSAYGCAPSPSLKLATNTALWNRQQDDMDINCGSVIDEGVEIAQLGRVLGFELCQRLAERQPARALHRSAPASPRGVAVADPAELQPVVTGADAGAGAGPGRGRQPQPAAAARDRKRPRLNSSH